MTAVDGTGSQQDLSEELHLHGNQSLVPSVVRRLEAVVLAPSGHQNVGVDLAALHIAVAEEDVDQMDDFSSGQLPNLPVAATFLLEIVRIDGTMHWNTRVSHAVSPSSTKLSLTKTRHATSIEVMRLARIRHAHVRPANRTRHMTTICLQERCKETRTESCTREVTAKISTSHVVHRTEPRART